MKFEGYLYDVEGDCLAVSRACREFRIALRPDSPVYEGHFPGFPITPGVALIAMVRELLESRVFGLPGGGLSITSVDDAKFLSPLTPGMSPVTVRLTAIADGSAKAEISSPAALHARMSLSFSGTSRSGLSEDASL